MEQRPTRANGGAGQGRENNYMVLWFMVLRFRILGFKEISEYKILFRNYDLPSLRDIFIIS